MVLGVFFWIIYWSSSFLLGFLSHINFMLTFGFSIWLRGVVFAPSKQSIYFNPLLGFIRNFAWRSRLLVNQGSTRNKKNPLCIHGPQSVMEVRDLFSLKLYYMYLLLVLFWSPMMVSWPPA